MISGNELGLSFPICFTVEKKKRKRSQTGKLTRPGIEPWPTKLEAAKLPLAHSGGTTHLRPRDCDSVTPHGFRGGRNGVWVDFSRNFCRFPQSQISFHHFSTLTSFISFAPVMVRQAWSTGILAIHIPSIADYIASYFSTRPYVGHELIFLF